MLRKKLTRAKLDALKARGNFVLLSDVHAERIRNWQAFEQNAKRSEDLSLYALPSYERTCCVDGEPLVLTHFLVRSKDYALKEISRLGYKLTLDHGAIDDLTRFIDRGISLEVEWYVFQNPIHDSN